MAQDTACQLKGVLNLWMAPVVPVQSVHWGHPQRLRHKNTKPQVCSAAFGQDSFFPSIAASTHENMAAHHSGGHKFPCGADASLFACPRLMCQMRLQVYEAIVRHVDWEVVQCLVIAGPGFTKDSFRTFLDAEAVRQDNRYIDQCCHCAMCAYQHQVYDRTN